MSLIVLPLVWLSTPSCRYLTAWFLTNKIGIICSVTRCNVLLILLQLLEYSGSSTGSSMKDCILLGACEAHETLPQSEEFPADIFTSCLTTPIKMALRWWAQSITMCLCSFNANWTHHFFGLVETTKNPALGNDHYVWILSAFCFYYVPN